MIDRDGYRPNVGIILCNAKDEVFWGKRSGERVFIHALDFLSREHMSRPESEDFGNG